MKKPIHLLPAPKKRRLDFPQFHRFIPAQLVTQSFILTQKSLLWLLLLTIIAANIYLHQPELAAYIARGTLQASSQTQYQSQKEAVLGEESDVHSTQPAQKRADAVMQKYTYWKNISLQHPDYRDAYVALATLSYELGYYSEVKRYINMTLSLDPNYPGLQTLLSILPKK